MENQTPSVVIPTQVSTIRPMLPSTAVLLKSALSDFKKHFWMYIILSAVPTLIMLSLGVLGFGGAFFIQKLTSSSIVTGVGIALGIFLILLAIILYIWSQVALIYAIVHSEQNLTIKEAFRQTWNKIGSYLWIGILTGVLVMGGMMLFGIPGLIFSIWFFFAVYIFMDQGDKGFLALLKSREYVRDYWFAIVGRIILMGLAIFAIIIPFMIFSFVIIAVMKENSEIAGLIVQTLQQIGQLLIYPFMAIFYVKIYQALKTIKDPVVLGPESQKDKKLITWLTILGYLIPLTIVILLLIIGIAVM